VAEAGECLPCLDEAVLGGVFCLGRRARHEVCGPERHVLMRPDQLRVSGGVAVEGPLERRGAGWE
jgi:hypothetical protein